MPLFFTHDAVLISIHLFLIFYLTVPFSESAGISSEYEKHRKARVNR